VLFPEFDLDKYTLSDVGFSLKILS
jgi:hypothetical protein